MAYINKNWHPITRLDVIYRGWGEEFILGTLASGKQRGRFLFEYTREAIERGIEFSPLHQPLINETFDNFEKYQEGLPGFIFDSLPDGWGRLLMDRLLRRNDIAPPTISPLDRLALLDNSTMGALTYRPSLALENSSKNHPTLCDLSSVAEQIRREVIGQDSEALAELVRLGGSPHGARPKALVEYDPHNGLMATSPFSGSEPWLVKFPGAEEQVHVCALEEVYATLARRAGINFPESRWFPLDNGLAAFGVRRFDRLEGLRIPVISMAGATQADFSLPCLDYDDILRATLQVTRSNTECKAQVRRMLFNVIMNNRDDHAKNFAFILNREDEWQLSPAYDLTFQEGPGGEHQSSVAGYGSDVSLTSLIKAASRGGVSQGYVKEAVQEITDVADTFTRLASQSDYGIPQSTIKKISDRIARNITSLKN